MRRVLTPLLCAALIGLLVPAPPASAQLTGAFTIVLDPTTVGYAAPAGMLANVPSGATSATVTVTLADGSTQMVTTTAEKGWKFDFALPGGTGTWFQVTALTSNGAGASLPNGPSAGTYPVEIPMPQP
jgi:hypothetical protein